MNKKIPNSIIERLDKFVDSYEKNRHLFVFFTNRIIYAKRNNDVLYLKGTFFTSKVKFLNKDNEISYSLKTKYSWKLYLVFLFQLVFISLIIFGNKVTINGNSKPDWPLRVGYVFVVLVFFAVLAMIFKGLKTKFHQKSEQALKRFEWNPNS